MGYTHYWQNETPFTADDWTNICLTVRNITKASRLPIGDATGNGNAPEFGPDELYLNGVGDDGHETFYLHRGVSTFEYCKTARKPYDTVVAAILCVLATAFPGFSASSDGDPDEWAEGLALAQKALRKVAGTPKIPVGVKFTT